MLVFRPLPWFTVFYIAGMAVLISLGTWQVQRLQWKLDIIAKLDARMSAPVRPFSDVMNGKSPEEAEYYRVTASGRFDHDQESYMFGHIGQGQVGFFVFTPFHMGTGETVLVNRGFVPQTKKDPVTRTDGLVTGDVEISGVVRAATSFAKTNFTPDPVRADRVWYWRDLEGMAAAGGLTNVPDLFIDADGTANPGGLPRGGVSMPHIRNRHLEYVITWFSFAVIFTVVYIAFHVSQGRLSFR